MSNYRRIAVIKTGWCEGYNGDLVGGAHANIAQHKEGHERYNFLPGPDGSFYGYTPPIGETEAAPSPKQADDWLIFFVAKKPGRSGIFLVGWYEDATFAHEYLARPEYELDPPGLELDVHGGEFSYTVTGPRAVLIPAIARSFFFAGDRLKRTPVCYLRGNGEAGDWREDLALALLDAKRDFEVAFDAGLVASGQRSLGGICGDPERRKEVEVAAIECVKSHFGERYECRDRQSDNCGFDLLFTHKKTREEHHVEVKGTSQMVPHFFMSTNEFAYAQKAPNWQLAMVTDALRGPKLTLMNYAEARKAFEWQTHTWHAVTKVK